MLPSRLAACALLCAACGAPPPDSATDGTDELNLSPDSLPEPARARRRADAALQTYLFDFWNGRAGYLDATHPSDGALTGYWTFAQGFEAVLDGAARTGGGHYRGLVETFYRSAQARGFSRPFYDDENWMALALLDAWELTGSPASLARARALYSNIMSAWDDTCCGAHPGGVWWDTRHTQKATAANAGAALTGARLHRATGDAASLQFAEKVYAYWHARMVDPKTGQVADHEDRAGHVTWWRFTYNEGLLIGAAVELYAATHETRYLDEARQTADFMISHEVVNTHFGPVLSDGNEAQCRNDCPQFKGIAYRYLAALQAVAPDPKYLAVLRASAEALWQLARDPSTGLFATDWAGPAAGARATEQQSAAAIALSVWASLAFGNAAPPAGTRYEAEDAIVGHVGLEAGHHGFSGWGYVAGWGHDGERVDFEVEAPHAGRYSIAFTYAAADGDARRRVSVNGTVVAPAHVFRQTGNWGHYATTHLDVDLPKGASTISLVFDAAHKSHAFLNLDALDLHPL